MDITLHCWAWTNDIVAIRRQLKIPASQFDNSLNELALRIYKQGFDIRFQAAQAIPVFINELVVRLVYAVRRMLKYFTVAKGESHSTYAMWNAYEPFTNPTVKRMLTVAHGTFCLIDLSDAAIRGLVAGEGTLNVVEFVLRLNIVGVGRFTISFYGEAKRAVGIHRAEADAEFAQREVTIVENYLNGLSLLSEIYDDRELVDFIEDLKRSDLYVQAFEKSAKLAELRKVPEENILRTKADIDSYFRESNHA